mmetsp:Transcript_32538/g.56269  ORF Transcript_32538/g.56269 Transcript_32538/m.56269 type:complete len:232 (-) Transcript_32538:237-932(-)
MASRSTTHDSFFIKGKSFFLDDEVIRKERRQKQQRYKAATRIQALYRGYCIRRDLQRHIQELETLHQQLRDNEALALRREQAAVKIQRAVRKMFKLPLLAKPSSLRYIRGQLEKSRESIESLDQSLMPEYCESPGFENEAASFNVSMESGEATLDVETNNACFRLLPTQLSHNRRLSSSILQVSKVFDELHFSRMSFCRSMMLEEPPVQVEDKHVEIETLLDLELKVKSEP